MKIGEILVKTSQIKEFLSEGKICFANEFLGRPYTVKGIVVDGNKIGRTMNSPTANIDTSNYFLPKEGVYLGLDLRWEIPDEAAGGTGDAESAGGADLGTLTH